MFPDTRSRRRGRRITFATAAVAVAATIVPLVGANPAGAATAPLVTADGMGIRIDENALLGPALETIEDQMQLYVDDMVQQGAEANSVMDDPDWVWTDSNLELAFDFVDAGTPGYPQGGLEVDAEIRDIRMQFYRYGEWWQPECLIEVNPTTSFINASAYVDASKLPNAPLTVNPITATWDEDPDHTIVEGNFLCNGYLINEWWDGLWGSGSDIADGIEAELNDVAQDLVDDLWADYVQPVVADLSEYGITFGTIEADDHGLVVTADVDATNGLLIPGDPAGAPRNVANAQDAGATSDVHALLAHRASDAIVSIHPNVVNQYLYAFRLATSGQFGSPFVSDSIEDVLLDPSVHGSYADAGWTVSLSMASPTAAPYVQPTGAGGAPEVRMDDIFLIVRNSSKGTSPVAVFRGSATGIDLVTGVRPGEDTWGPKYDPSTMSVSLTRLTANPDVAAFNPDPAAMLPYARNTVTYFDANILSQYVSLAPLTVGGLPVEVCTTCGRYPGDQRYTETFTVG